MTITWKTAALVALGLAVLAFAVIDSRTASGKLQPRAETALETAAIDFVGCGSRDRFGACQFDRRFDYPAGDLVVTDDAY